MKDLHKEEVNNTCTYFTIKVGGIQDKGKKSRGGDR